MDSLYGRLSGTVSPLAGHCGPVRHLSQPSSRSLFFANGGSPSCGQRYDAPVLGASPGLRLPAVRVHPEGPQQGSPVPQLRGDSGGAFLATQAVDPGPTGAPGGSASPSTSAQGSAPPTALPPFSSEPPSTRPDWITHCQRSKLHFGFSLLELPV